MSLSTLWSGSIGVVATEETCFPIHSASRPASYRWLFLALILFLLQVLPYLSYRWVTDESWYAGPAYSLEQGSGLKDPAIGPNDIENHLDVRPPGTALVIAAGFKLFGVGPATARLGSVLAGLAIVFFTYRLAREFIGEEGAIIATFLTATDNLIVLISRTARPEALTTMAILASLLAMTQYAKRSGLIWAFLSGLLIATATMFHVTVLGYIVSLAILALAIDIKDDVFPLRGAMTYLGGFVVGIVPFAAWIMTAPLGRDGFGKEYLSRAASTPFVIKLVREGHRYSDLMGLNLLHGHGLESIPLRLPIPLLFVVSSVLLWKYRRRCFYLELIVLVPSMLWLCYTVNKSSRYVAIVAPLFGIVIGAAVAATRAHRKVHRVALCVAYLAVATQMLSNFVLLQAAKRANYDKVSAELLSVIPPGETAYGTITFWLGLHSRAFISYERTDPFTAVSAFHARYFVVGDRMMTAGSAQDDAFYKDLNQDLAELKTHSELVGHFPDPYYGDLKVYKVHR